VVREALQAAARETLRLCRLSKAAQAALEPQAPAPRGRPPAVWQSQSRGSCWIERGFVHDLSITK